VTSYYLYGVHPRLNGEGGGSVSELSLRKFFHLMIDKFPPIVILQHFEIKSEHLKVVVSINISMNRTGPSRSVTTSKTSSDFLSLRHHFLDVLKMSIDY
jgi:hypothetical protein